MHNRVITYTVLFLPPPPHLLICLHTENLWGAHTWGMEKVNSVHLRVGEVDGWSTFWLARAPGLTSEQILGIKTNRIKIRGEKNPDFKKQSQYSMCWKWNLHSIPLSDSICFIISNTYFQFCLYVNQFSIAVLLVSTHSWFMIILAKK